MSTLLKSELNLGIENDEVEYTLSDLGIKHENEEGKERPMEERALAEDKGHVFTAVLSREESDGIIAFLEREGAANWRTQGHGDSASEERRYRNYSRQCFFSTELGDLLEKRMGGQLLPIPSKKRKPATGGVRQRLGELHERLLLPGAPGGMHEAADVAAELGQARQRQRV